MKFVTAIFPDVFFKRRGSMSGPSRFSDSSIWLVYANPARGE